MEGEMDRINSFKDEFRFLSNFFPSPVVYGDTKFPAVEHAFQAAKTLNQADRCAIMAAKTPGEAKRLGRYVTLRPAWDDIKLNVMRDLVWSKFTEYPELRAKLLATEDAELVEGNTWQDEFWGVDLRTGKGENHLGKLLMETRDKIREQELAVLYAKRVAPELNLFEDMLKRARIQYEKDARNGSVVFEIECDIAGFVYVTFGKNGELIRIGGYEG
jgi:hypothetical protein